MAPAFRKGTKEQVKAGEAEYWVPENTDTNAVIATKTQTSDHIGGRIVKTKVGKTVFEDRVGGDALTHTAVTYVTKDSSGAITGATRVLFIENDKSQWRPAAISRNGGKTYQFSDPEYPLMATGGPNGGPVAGAALQNDLNNTDSDLHKNLDAQVNDSFKRVGAEKIKNKGIAIDSIKNNADQQDEEEATEDGSTDTKDSEADIDPSDTSTITKIQDKLKLGEMKGTRTTGYGDIMYPLDLSSTSQDVIKFTMMKYVPSDISIRGPSDDAFFVQTNERRGNREILGTVMLPIPGGIKSDDRVSWSGASANAAQLALANVALNAIASGPGAAAASISQIVQKLSGKSNEGAKTAIATVVAGSASGMGQQLITRTTGAILNPNMELLFNNPALRQFSFQFQLSARQREESMEIVRILRFFKQGSSVKRSGANLFLKSPHTYKIQYLHRNGTDNPYINKIKEVACTGVSVDYTPNNNYATFPDGAMTSYGLTLQFQELTPVYDDDYKEDNDLSIGF